AIDVIEVLGRDEEQAQLAGRRGGARGRVLVVALVAVDAAGRETETLVEVAELVAHQGEQRGDDDRDPAEQCGRELVEEALAVTCRLNAQKAAAGEQGRDALALARTEAREAEARVEEMIEVGGGDRHRRGCSSTDAGAGTSGAAQAAPHRLSRAH